MYSLGIFSAGDLATRDINGGSFGLLTSMNVASHFDGNSDWATNFSPKCDAKSAEASLNGFTTIALSCTDPDHGFGAEPPTPEALDPQALEIITQPAHGTLGGLSTSTGKIVYTPNKDFKGTDTFTYTGSDDVSNAPPATVTIHVGAGGGGGGGADKTAPTVSGLKISNKRWRAGSKLASISRDARRHDDLLQAQRGRPRHPHLPAQAGRQEGGQHLRRGEGRPQQGALPGPAEQAKRLAPGQLPPRRQRQGRRRQPVEAQERARASRSSRNRTLKGPEMPKLRRRLAMLTVSLAAGLLLLPAAAQAAPTIFGSRLNHDPANSGECEPSVPARSSPSSTRANRTATPTPAAPRSAA